MPTAASGCSNLHLYKRGDEGLDLVPRMTYSRWRLLGIGMAIVTAGACAILLGLAVWPSSDSENNSPRSQRTACSASRASGDFDGDTRLDDAHLQVLPLHNGCRDGARARFELTSRFGSGAVLVEEFIDCSAPDCELIGASDFDGDGRDELAIRLGPGAAVSFGGVYTISEEGAASIELMPPGDPAASMSPGPIRLGGPHDAISESGFDCRIQNDGSRVVVAWQAERSDAISRWDLHLTKLELRDGAFSVIATRDQRNAVQTPEAEGLCP